LINQVDTHSLDGSMEVGKELSEDSNLI